MGHDTGRIAGVRPPGPGPARGKGNGDAWESITKAIVADHGRIDVFVNNAGIFTIAPLLATDRELWDRIIAVNQTGVYLGLAAVAPVMVGQRSGSIINISSIAGLRGAGRA